MDLIEKEFQLTDFELKDRENSEQAAKAAKLPVFLIKNHIVRNLESYRKSVNNHAQVQPECAGWISKERSEIQGHCRKIGISVYTAQQTDHVKQPLFYFIHGGGFIAGSSEVNDNLMRLIAGRTGAVAASVDYTLSPEAKYPEGLLDCQKGLEFLAKNDWFNIDPEKIILSGDSAGGNLAAALTLKLKHEKVLNVSKQVLLYPVTDLAYLDGESYRQKGAAYTAMHKFILIARDLYLGSTQDRYIPYVSPVCAKLKGPVPDTLLLLAEVDGLRSEGIRYGEILSKSGTKVRCVVYKEATHAFINNLGKSYVADDAADEIIRFISGE